MSESSKDTLLVFSKTLARIIQGLCALAVGAVLLLIPVVLMISQDMLPGFGGDRRSDIIEASPLSVVAILAMLALILAALFRFFGKLHAIIVSVGDGDPFTPDNATRLNTMAWLFLGVKILAVLVGGLRLYLANLVNTDATDSLDLSLYDLDAILVVMVLFILARIFRHGAAMRDDLEGTV